MAISDSTVFEDSRRALKCAIWQRHNDRVVGRDWVTKVPGEDPPDGYASSSQAWAATLRLATRILTNWGYVTEQVNLGHAEGVLDKVLTASVGCVFDRITANRPSGVSTHCDAGERT